MTTIEPPLILISVSSKRSSNGVYFYNALFELMKIKALYLGIESSTLEGFRESFNFLGLHAASVAAPFKIDVLQHLDALTPSARRTGSVNSVRSRKGQLEGHNTDLAGATALLSSVWAPGVAPRVEIFGSGGVVSSVVAAVREVRPQADIMLHSRNESVGQELCKQLQIAWKNPGHSVPIDLWINATPASLSEPTMTAERCLHANMVFDLVANQAASPFELAVQSRGQQFIRGFDFYRAQFAEQFFFYFDQRVDFTMFDKLATQREVCVEQRSR